MTEGVSEAMKKLAASAVVGSVAVAGTPVEVFKANVTGWQYGSSDWNIGSKSNVVAVAVGLIAVDACLGVSIS